MTEWSDVLGLEKQQDYFTNLMGFVKQERESGKVIYPPHTEMFSTFRLTPFNQVKVVILGQDPYHGPNQANGMAFSVAKGVKIPPSLRNMFQEIESDLGTPYPSHGDLTKWATQGVLLLNAVLSVEGGAANSHKNKGWETFTDKTIEVLNQAEQHIVFLLWGAYAQKKALLVDQQKHSVLKAPHPSPLSAHRGFFGCRHFSKANQLLQQHQQQPIDWSLDKLV